MNFLNVEYVVSIHPPKCKCWVQVTLCFQFCEVKVWQNWLENSKFSQNCTGKTNLSKFFLENNFLCYKILQKRKRKRKKFRKMEMNKESVKVII
jgi:hypothetical protein